MEDVLNKDDLFPVIEGFAGVTNGGVSIVEAICRETVTNDTEIPYKKPVRLNKRLYKAIMTGTFPPVYHAVVSIIVNYNIKSIRPYDLHSHCKAWIKANVSNDLTTSYKYIGVVLSVLKLLTKKEKAGSHVVLYNIDLAKARKYWHMLSTDDSFVPLLSNTLKKGYSEREYCLSVLKDIGNVYHYDSSNAEKLEKVRDICRRIKWLVDCSEIEAVLKEKEKR